MGFSLIQILLILIVTFIATIDQFNFLQSLYRPIVIGPIIGLILGDLTSGLVIGASYELLAFGIPLTTSIQAPNPVIGGIMATTFGIGLGIELDAALTLAIPFALLGQYMVTLFFTVCSTLMLKADQYVTSIDTRKFDLLNQFTPIGLSILFCILVLLGLLLGHTIGDSLVIFLPDWAWNGLGAAGNMMPALGLALLLKTMLSKKYIIFLALGFILVSSMNLSLLTITIIGIIIAVYDFYLHTEYSYRNKGVDLNDGL